MLRIIIGSLNIDDKDRDGWRIKSLAASLDRDPRTLYVHFDLKPRLHSYICCPECFALYDNDSSCVPTCTQQPTTDSDVCGAELFRAVQIGAKQYMRPVRLYVTQSLKEWVGRLLSRESIEKSLLAPDFQTECPKHMQDFWDGEGIRKFTGPDGLNYMHCPEGELRLVFSLSSDGFVPFLNSGLPGSSTAIYMACMNLPVSIRYQMQNLFLVGVIPGPHKPSLDQINHALNRLVDQMLELWNPGIFLSRTALFKEGRLVRGAIAILVADILAARQMGGFSSIGATSFCSCCTIKKKDMENFNVSTWIPRDSSNHHDHACQWRDATTSAARTKLFEKNSVRYSPLLRLPYWRMIEFTVIDSMHAHWINSITNHLTNVWAMDAKAESGDGSLAKTNRPRFARPTNTILRKSLEHLQLLIQEKSDDPDVDLLDAFTRPKFITPSLVFHLCFDHDIRRAGPKAMQARHLIDWVSHLPRHAFFFTD